MTVLEVKVLLVKRKCSVCMSCSSILFQVSSSFVLSFLEFSLYVFLCLFVLIHGLILPFASLSM